jgi:hypothetical protein
LSTIPFYNAVLIVNAVTIIGLFDFSTIPF